MTRPLKKVLIIPSWYPTVKNPLNGVFFLEQARFLEKELRLDIRVLYGIKKSQPLLVWTLTFIKAWLLAAWPISKEPVAQNPTAFGFSFPANRRIPESLQIGLERLIIRKAYYNLERSGWIPDLLHAQSGMDAGIYAHHVSMQTGIPFVLIEHQVQIFHHYSRVRARAVLDAFLCSDRLASVSSAQMRQMLLHEPMCLPTVIPNLIDEDRFSILQKPQRRTFHILTVMYAFPVKGYLTFFESMAILKQALFDFSFTVIGKGVDIFKDVAAELGIIGYGEFLERVDREKIPNVFSNSDVYVCTSDFETFGISAREAMLCGIPVVSTANGGVEEGITPENGLVVPIRDSRAIAQAILKIKNEMNRFDPMRIREIAIQQCGKDHFLERMREFYQIIS